MNIGFKLHGSNAIRVQCYNNVDVANGLIVTVPGTKHFLHPGIKLLLRLMRRRFCPESPSDPNIYKTCLVIYRTTKLKKVYPISNKNTRINPWNCLHKITGINPRPFFVAFYVTVIKLVYWFCFFSFTFYCYIRVHLYGFYCEQKRISIGVDILVFCIMFIVIS